MSITKYTITKADGTKQVKEIEYTPLTMEEIYAKAAKLADGETSGTKFEDRLYTVAVEEGQKKAQFDAITQNLGGEDRNVTQDDVSNILTTASRSTAAALNRDRITVAADEKIANDEFMRDMSTMGAPASAWESKIRDTTERRNLLAQIDSSLNTGNYDFLTAGQGTQGATGNNLLMSYGDPENYETYIPPNVNPVQPSPRPDLRIEAGGSDIGATEQALRDIPDYDVFSQYVAMSPYSVGPLREAAMSRYNPLATQFALGGRYSADPLADNVQEFASFLQEPRLTNPTEYANLIRRAGDIAGMTGDQWADSAYLQDPRAVSIRGMFTDPEQARQLELASANLPFQQMGSSATRRATGNVIQNMYDRFRAQYPLVENQGAPSSFLNYIRAKNLGGMFGTQADRDAFNFGAAAPRVFNFNNQIP